MSDNAGSGADEIQSEVSAVNDEQSIKHVIQLLDNIAIVRKHYVTEDYHYENTLKKFVDKIGIEHEPFIKAILDHVAETDNWYSENAHI